jgi:uncharacterized protein
MKDSTESREARIPQPATAIVSHLVRDDKAAKYFEAQKAITDAARRFTGFVGTEVLGPIPGLQAEWVAIFRLESNEAMKRWLECPEHVSLAARIEECLSEPSHMLVLASDDDTEPPVAMVFTHRITKDRVDDYLSWRRRVIAAQAHFPGYLATDFFKPHGKQDEWIDIVRYKSAAGLAAWMESKERRALLKELEPIVESMHAHQVTGLEGWFALNREADASNDGPASWKQALAVLFALYPTVMALDFLTPLWRNQSFPVQMLISNILSVVLLTWLVMPAVSRLLNFWLGGSTRNWWNELLGIGTVSAGLILFVFIFKAL